MEVTPSWARSALSVLAPSSFRWFSMGSSRCGSMKGAIRADRPCAGETSPNPKAASRARMARSARGAQRRRTVHEPLLNDFPTISNTTPSLYSLSLSLFIACLYALYQGPKVLRAQDFPAHLQLFCFHAHQWAAHESHPAADHLLLEDEVGFAARIC